MNFHGFRYHCSVVFLVQNGRHSIISQIYLDILLLAGCLFARGFQTTFLRQGRRNLMQVLLGPAFGGPSFP